MSHVAQAARFVKFAHSQGICEGLGTLDHIVAVTFTEKAAGEMKLRLRTQIERSRQDCAPEQQALLELQSAQRTPRWTPGKG